jgi:hypothetical protein
MSDGTVGSSRNLSRGERFFGGIVQGVKVSAVVRVGVMDAGADKPKRVAAEHLADVDRLRSGI